MPQPARADDDGACAGIEDARRLLDRVVGRQPGVGERRDVLGMQGRLEADDGSLIDRVKEKYQADVREYDAPGERRLAVTIEPVKVRAVAMG